MHRPDGTPGKAWRRWLRRTLVFLALWAGWTVFSLRCTPPYLVGIDGYYHTRVSHQYALHGPAAFANGRFPWTTASVFHRHWADIEYLFHLEVAPFTAGWRAPPVRTGEVIALGAPSVHLDAGSTVVPGTVLEVRPARGLPGVGHLVVTAVDGRAVRGRLVRDDRTAPLAAGFRVSAPGATGVLVDLGRGRARLPPGTPAGPVTLLEGTTTAGTARVGPARAGHPGAGRPFSVTWLEGAGLVPTLGAASLEDDRGFVDRPYDDAASLAAWLKAHHANPSALPAPLKLPRHLLGPDTLVLRGRLALAFLQVGVFAALIWILTEEAVPFAVLGPLFLLLAADGFSWRFSMVRAQLPSMALLLLGLHLASRRRFVALVVLGTLYALTYAAPEALVVEVGIAALVDLGWSLAVAHRRPPWVRLAAPVAGAVVGVLVGLAVHPNTLNELRLLGVVNLNIGSASFLAPVAKLLRHVLQVPLLSQVPGMTTGMEFKPPSTHYLTMLFPLWGAALVLGAGYLFGRARPRRFTVQALALALAWTVLFLRSARFSEYMAPFWALTLALAVDDLRRAGVHRRLAALAPGRQRLLVVVGGLFAAVVGVRLWIGVGATYDGVGPAPYRASALWMRSHLPDGAQVFESAWSGTAQLLHYNLRQRFLVDLDPRYMIDVTEDGLKPGQLATVYVDLCGGRARLADPRPGHAGAWLTRSQAMHQLFHADYVLVDREVDPVLLSGVRADPRHFVWLREDATAALFRIRP